MLLECVWLEPSVPAQTASAGAPKKAHGQRNRNPQPPAVPENGMCCWGVAGRRWGHWELGKSGGSCHKAISVLVETEGGWCWGRGGRADRSC